METTMTVEVTNDQHYTIDRLSALLDGRKPVFHGYARPGADREYGQEDAVWITFSGIYVLVQTNGDTERDVLTDFLELTDAEIDEVLQPGSNPGFVRG